ncbi:MAG: amidase [Candidatus Berkelbacteria bacterium]|nr:amidase [Candidatus Berkelbacteria bacterium]
MAIFCVSVLIDTKQAKAATFSGNLDYAREVVSQVTPQISLTSINAESRSTALVPEGYLTKPLVTETKITQQPKLNQSRRVVSSSTKSVINKTKLVGEFKGNSFPYGYCTYYVAIKRPIFWRGNAITWLSGARSAGFATGDTPQAGAIMVTSEGGAAGHVAMVDAVNGDGTITVSEMNYSGFGVISSRTISASYGAIKGYIY